MKNRTIATTISALALTLGLTELMIWLPGARARAQQQDRQLVQTGGTSATTRRLALVIGNGAYTKAQPLKTL